LPDHVHALWALPEGDADFSIRWSLIKNYFSRGQEPRPRSASKISKREKGIWQRRYWEHAIRDQADLDRHVDYIHINPVKHGCVTRAIDWPYSSFHRYVQRGLLSADWGGDVRDIQGSFGEKRGHGAKRLCPPYRSIC
jgi:putative transposase